jgi:predicted Zn-dependent protease
VSWSATRFDGRSAAGETVLLRVDGDALAVFSRSSIERFPVRELAVSESFDHAPRMIGLPGGGTLEVPDPERTLPAALEHAGTTRSWVVRMQSAWAAVVVALAVLLGAAAWTYVEGLPIAAKWIAHSLPADLERSMGEKVVQLLDQHALHPSSLPAAQRERIASRFRAAASVVAPGIDARVEFRAGQVNAFALPGGTIVVFDELVALAGSDERLLAVLGHELGHVAGRHSTRQLLQALGVGALAGLLWGDFSTMAGNVPLILGMMRYGREFEREADAFALAFLRGNGLSARPMLEMLAMLQAKKRGRGAIPEFLSTHPAIEDRLEWLRSEVEGEQPQRPGP